MKKKAIRSLVGVIVASMLSSVALPVFAEESEEVIETTFEEITEESDSEAITDVTRDEIVSLVNDDTLAIAIEEQIEEALDSPVDETEVIVEEDPEVEVTQIGIRVPEGFGVEFGFQSAYKHTYVADTIESNNVWVFNIQNDKGKDLASGNFFYRVYSIEENNDAVTYWGWLTAAEFKASKGAILEVTEDMLCLNDEGKTKEVEVQILDDIGNPTGEVETKEVSMERNADTVDPYLTNNQYDTQDILITGNENGYINLQVGDTWTLNCYRMWEIIESYMNAQISQPDFHISISGIDGSGTDCVSITKNTGDGSANTITALSEGTAILRITYDAVTVDSAMGGEYFSAIAPENTAVFVVQVSDNNAEVNDGIDLDAEVDVQYYTGNNGAVIVSTPDTNSKIAISRCTYDENGKLVLTQFLPEEDEASGIKRNDDGSFEIIGLTEGSSVVRVTDENGNTAYQVVKAKQISFGLQTVDGEVLDASEHEFEAGESVKIVADKFYDTFMKSAGVYNGSSALQFTLTYIATDGTEKSVTFKSAENAKGFAIQYDQAGNPIYRTVDVTIPEDWDGESELNFDCDIYRNTRFGLKLTGHRTVYKNTGETNVNGYVVTYTSAASSTSDAITADDLKDVVTNVDITPSYDIPLDTSILSGVVVGYNNESVAYKNIVE